MSTQSIYSLLLQVYGDADPLQLVREASLHLLPASPNYANQLREVMSQLNLKPATSRNLGAFSFVVANLTDADFYDTEGVHFIHKNPAYAVVYYGFGGKSTLPIRKDSKMTLGKSRPAPMVSHYYKEFSSDLLDTFGEATPYYFVPLPSGEQYKVVEEYGLTKAYVDAGVGPRMIIDTDGTITIAGIYHIIGYCADKPELSPHIHLFRQIRDLSYHCTTDLDLLEYVGELLKDTNYVESIRKFGDAFRIKHLTRAQKEQALALGPGVEIGDEHIDALILDAHDHLETSNSALHQRAVQLNQIRIQARADTMRVMGYTTVKIEYVDDSIQDNNDGQSAKEYILSMPPIDVFMYATEDVLYVLPSHQLEELENDPGTADYAVKEAREWLDYICTNGLLFPSGPVEYMFDAIVHPSCNLLTELNK